MLWSFPTAWYDSARPSMARFVFPLQFSTALGRDYLHVIIVALPLLLKNGSAPRLWMRGASLLPQQTTKLKRCTHSKQLRSILCWLYWFKSSGSVVSIAASSMTQTVTIFSGQSVISWVYTSRFGNGYGSLVTSPKVVLKKSDKKNPKVSRTEPYHAVEKHH